MNIVMKKIVDTFQYLNYCNKNVELKLICCLNKNNCGLDLSYLTTSKFALF